MKRTHWHTPTHTYSQHSIRIIHPCLFLLANSAHTAGAHLLGCTCIEKHNSTYLLWQRHKHRKTCTRRSELFLIFNIEEHGEARDFWDWWFSKELSGKLLTWLSQRSRTQAIDVITSTFLKLQICKLLLSYFKTLRTLHISADLFPPVFSVHWG